MSVTYSPESTDRDTAEVTFVADDPAAPHVVRSFDLVGDAPAPGSEVTVQIFAPGELVKVTGTSKGRGFQGLVHRYHAGGGPETHGNTRHRKPGSIGTPATPSRVTNASFWTPAN